MMICRRLLRLTSETGASVTGLMGLGPTKIYGLIKDELMTPPVKLTLRTSAWPEDEIAAIIQARISGKSDAEIRALVAKLVAARTQPVGEVDEPEAAPRSPRRRQIPVQKAAA
jgi:prophage regulatory protein